MNFVSQILFFFGAIGAFNSFILALYFLWSTSYAKLEHKLLGLFLLVLSLRVLKSLFYSFSTEDPIWFLQSGPSFFLLIGPLLFSYMASIINPGSFWIKHWKSHIILWIFIVLFLAIFIPFTENVQFHKQTILPMINVQWLSYILLSGVLLFSYAKNKKSITIQHKWLGIFCIINLFIWASFALIHFDYFISGSIIFSISFYVLFVFFLFNKKLSESIFTKTKIKKPISISTESQSAIQQLITVVNSEKLYTNPNLKIADIAKKINLSTHELSKLLNENLGKSFTDFINEYRIEEAKRLIADNTNYTVEAIGNMSGFHSKSAFYKAFKMYTNTTPARYKAT